MNRSLTVFLIATHARAAQKLLQVCEQVKITWSQVRIVGRMKTKRPKQCQQVARVLVSASLNEQIRLAHALKIYSLEVVGSSGVIGCPQVSLWYSSVAPVSQLGDGGLLPI
jgi:hypothetical protein